jgi:hypothetical protein
MAVGGHLGKFYCNPCTAARRALRSDEAKATEFLRQVAAALPAYLTPDEREDAAQSVFLDILAAKLAPRLPAPVTLRTYAKAARGIGRDRFKFVSLSQPTRDGREFGEHIAA